MIREANKFDKEAIIEVLPSIEAALGERIDALGPSTRSVLQAAAVLGRRFRPNELPALVDAQEIAVPLALEQLLEERLIEREANLVTEFTDLFF